MAPSICRGAGARAARRREAQGDLGDQEGLLRELRRGQAALRRLRCRAAAVWVALAVSTAVVYQAIFPGWQWYGRSSPFQCPFERASADDFWRHLLSELLFNARLLLLGLAPLADDRLLTRAALLLDASFIAWNRKTVLTCMFSGQFLQTPLLQQVMYVTYLARGVVVVALALWAAGRPTSKSAQAWMWATLGVCLASNLLERVLFGALVTALSRRLDGELGQVPANALSLWVILRPGLRRRAQAKVRRWTLLPGAAATAAAIACLLGGLSPGDAVRRARERFRAVRASDLGPADLAAQSPGAALHGLAKPVGLGSCDAFISHSWRDPAGAKWGSLQAWRADFAARHGREPQLWFDRCCVDQSNIEEDLRCLPVFLSGCRSLVVLCGPSYLSRLWCIVELFTFLQIHGSLDRVTLVKVLREGHEEDDSTDIETSFRSFDVSKCQCLKPDDKEKLLAMIETVFGSVGEFSSVVAKLVQQLGPRPLEAGLLSISDSETGTSDPAV